MKIKEKRNKGMTLPEIMVSFIVASLLLGVVMSMWYFAYRNWSIERIRTTLRINLEIAMERLKEELRLSSADYMSFYKPAGATEYTAISFTLATSDANGFFVLDTDGSIYWDRSIIYHVYDNPDSGKTELRRTEFASNHDIIMDEAKRAAQLESVVLEGDGSQAFNSVNASTKVIFENMVDLEVIPKTQEFDGYSPTTKRSDNIAFGSIKLAPGNHDFKFEVTDINPSSTSYELGIDTLSITPSGCLREIETHTPVASSGKTTSKVYAVGWSGNNYLEYNATALGDYVTFRLYYDLWQESNFNNSIRVNTVLAGNDLYLKLATPEEGAVGCWQASVQTGVQGVDYPASGETIILPANVSIRNVLSQASIDRNGKLIRVKFVAHSSAALVLNEAYIVQRLIIGEPTCDDGTGTTVQFFFSDAPVAVGGDEPEGAGETIGGTVGVTPTSVTVPAGHYAWSNWAVLDIDETKDYFVTFSTPLANVTYWKPESGASVNSYYSESDGASQSVWTNSGQSSSVYALEEAENWTNEGSVTSTIYDTKLASPNYNQIAWSFNKPSGTEITVKARSSNDPNMAGATDWGSIAGSTVTPYTLSIGSGRYVQFQAILTNSSPYSEYPWIDNCIIDWPGEAKMCEISAYFTQAPNYGIIKLTVDGQDLIKGLKLNMSLSEVFRGVTYQDSLTVETEPRNTGR